ncbi:hypothetical protein RhiirA4_550640 [Rhizophagus irregularis]|uniref:DUF6570 domain-containing protein n=1 Tax=Rhizophagus irregularis TaxID=588596 RepID=A0A2I1HND5_9GLOM|nr:hypothetical protein RhiirA4_550640 [Rhizophagus irregularis]
MDPGEVPDKLRDLTEIEEILLARVFPVMSVYRLRGGSAWISRKRYQLSSRCPRICFKAPLLLDVLVIRRQSASNAEAFRDFKVRCDKVTQALIWLVKTK